MNVQDQITNLFVSLDKNQQITLLRQLSRSTKVAALVSDFSNKHSREHGTGIEFSVTETGPQHCPVVKVRVHTAYGVFHGSGISKETAKLNAVENAASNWQEKKVSTCVNW